MNGIEKITDRITQDTQAEIQALLTQAQQQAEQIVADCQAEAERIRTEILEKGQQELAAHRARLESMNQLDERKAVLAAKQAMVEEAFEAAIVRLCALPEEEMVPLLARLAAANSRSGDEEILLAPAQRAAYGQKVVDQANQLRQGGRLTLGPEDSEIQGGCILRQGAVDITCTFAMLTRQRRTELSGKVAEILYPPKQGL